jgi:hypothetical protein
VVLWADGGIVRVGVVGVWSMMRSSTKRKKCFFFCGVCIGPLSSVFWSVTFFSRDMRVFDRKGFFSGFSLVLSSLFQGLIREVFLK